MPTLTKKQKEVLDFIKEFISSNGYAPSYGEIARSLGLSSQSTIHVHVENLRAKGYLAKKWNANRSIDVADHPPSARLSTEVPLAGRIVAGEPLEAIEDVQTIGLPPDMVGKRETYVLEVQGDSMIDDHVVHGDFIIVEKRQNIHEGDMVVALIQGGEATLKRYYQENGKIRLQPSNHRYKAMVYDERDVDIQGVVIGILRKFKAH